MQVTSQHLLGDLGFPPWWDTPTQPRAHSEDSGPGPRAVSWGGCNSDPVLAGLKRQRCIFSTEPEPEVP